MIIPQAQGKDLTTVQRISHGLQATFPAKILLITKQILGICTHLIGDWIVCCYTRPVEFRVLNGLAILNPDSTNFDQISVVCSIGSDELCDEGDGPGGIHCFAWSVEVGLVRSVRVEIAAIFIADSSIPIIRIVAALNAFTSGVLVDGAGVGCVRLRYTANKQYQLIARRLIHSSN